MKYLNRLKDEQIIEFLNSNGLFLLDDLSEARNLNSAENLYLRCMSNSSIETDTFRQFKEFLASKQPILFTGLQSYFNTDNIHLFALNDFMIQRLFVLDELTDFDYKLQENYHELFCLEFSSSKEYEKDYNNFVNQLSQEP